MDEFYIMISRKYFSGFFWGGRGLEGATPLPPVSYAYGWAPGLPPAKSGPDITVVVYSFVAYVCATPLYRRRTR